VHDPLDHAAPGLRLELGRGATGGLPLVGTVAGAGHPQRCGDDLRDEVLEPPPGHPLGQEARDDEAHARVGVHRAGPGDEGTGEQVVDPLLAAPLDPPQLGHRRQTGCVREQHPQGHLPTGTEPRQVGGRGPVEVGQPLLDQPQDDDGGEQLGDRGQVVAGGQAGPDPPALRERRAIVGPLHGVAGHRLADGPPVDGDEEHRAGYALATYALHHIHHDPILPPSRCPPFGVNPKATVR